MDKQRSRKHYTKN